MVKQWLLGQVASPCILCRPKASFKAILWGGKAVRRWRRWLKILGWFRYSECSRERFTDIETPQMAQFCWYIFHTVNKQHQTILQESFHQQQWVVKQRTSGIELGRASDLSNKHGFFTNGGLQPQIYCWGHNVSHRSMEITQQALSLELAPMNISPA